MSSGKKIGSALISVYDKTGLEPIIHRLNELGVELYSTGGTAEFIQKLGVKVTDISELTGYPPVFHGRVKTLHPAVFGGILYRRDNSEDLAQAKEFNIRSLDLVVVDLYPFEETLKNTGEEAQLIEKIDIGGISLIRAGAKNFNDVLIVPSVEYYGDLLGILQSGETTREQRRLFATRAFEVSSHYDSQIFTWMNGNQEVDALKLSLRNGNQLRYGENPAQKARFYGNMDEYLTKLNGKELSYNNLQDIGGALDLLTEFDDCSCVIVKHTNACGVAEASTVGEAWTKALSCDPVSAFGGIVAFNKKLDAETCSKLHEFFFEVLIAPDFDEAGLTQLTSKKNRIIVRLNKLPRATSMIKQLSFGCLWQETDNLKEIPQQWELKAGIAPAQAVVDDMLFGMKVVKHLKSNAIVLVKDRLLIGSGTGQTNRVDAVKQSVEKAIKFGFDVTNSTLCSDAFFPFSDSAEIAFNAGVTAIAEPGGSIRDEDTVKYCTDKNITLMFTGNRHFKH